MTIEKLTEIITATLPNTNEEKIALDALLVPEICEDSLATVDLAMGIEDETGVNVPDDVMPTFKTLKDLLDYLNEQGA